MAFYAKPRRAVKPSAASEGSSSQTAQAVLQVLKESQKGVAYQFIKERVKAVTPTLMDILIMQGKVMRLQGRVGVHPANIYQAVPR